MRLWYRFYSEAINGLQVVNEVSVICFMLLKTFRSAFMPAVRRILPLNQYLRIWKSPIANGLLMLFGLDMVLDNDGNMISPEGLVFLQKGRV